MKKIGAGLLSLLLLIACVLPASAEMSGETAETSGEELTLENMMDAWDRRDMEQLHTYYEALYTPLAYDESEGQPTITPYWQSGGIFNNEQKMCHQKLTMYGFLLYISFVQKFYGRSIANMGFTLDDLGVLMEYSEKPDIEEFDGFTFAGHFYDPDTGKNWMNDMSATAKSRASDHYIQAIQHYKKGHRTSALKELGRALHYLQDVNEPHHASNKTVKNSNHKEFEAFVTPIVDDLVELFEITDDRSFYDGYVNHSVSSSVHEAAVFAKRFIGLATNDSANYEDYWKLAVLFTVGGSITCTSALIYRFAYEGNML